ncbi:MAG: MFS transporter [Gammaproteobacteria bacterium]|nr:MFS transporter [Gammaproteobacteria bacterium]
MQIKQIDESPLSALQMLVLAICFVLNLLDGMDVMAISYSAPVITAEWSITREALGIVFSAALVGMTIGAVFISPLTDRIGRRKMIMISLAMIGVGMIATSFANSVISMGILRLLTGLGIGSILASSTSMVSEYSPNRLRNFNITIYHSGYPIGAILTGLIATLVLTDYGWRPLFIMAGVISFGMLPVVYFLLPESLDFLVTSRRPGALEQANAILRRMRMAAFGELPPVEEKLITSTGVRAVLEGVRRLLEGRRKIPTMMLWAAFMMSFATLYFLFSWVVILARDSGLAIEDALYAGIAQNLGAFVGTLILGYLSNRFGLRRIIFIFFMLAAVVIVPYGFVKTSVAIILILIFLLMFFVQGAFAGLYIVAARLYPTEIRTTGIGWAIGFGRIGAIFGPSIAGFLLGAGLSISWTFVVFAIPMVIAGLTIIKLRATEIS